MPAPALAVAMPEIAWLVPSLRQPILVIGGLRWIAVFICLWMASERSDLRPLAAVVVLVETIIGLGSYFAGFKSVYFLGAVALLSVRYRSSRISWAGLAVVGVLAIGLGIAWQAVKLDYRPFLSQGERSQSILVSPAKRYGFLVERTLTLEAADLSRGLDAGIERLWVPQYFHTAGPYRRFRRRFLTRMANCGWRRSRTSLRRERSFLTSGNRTIQIVRTHTAGFAWPMPIRGRPSASAMRGRATSTSVQC